MTMLHGIHPCTTCPFRKELKDGWFSPLVLDETIGKNLREGRHVHVCHKANGATGKKQRMCVGFMRFVRHNRIPNENMRIGTVLGVLQPDKLSDEVPINLTWDDVLDTHAAQLGKLVLEPGERLVTEPDHLFPLNDD